MRKRFVVLTAMFAIGLSSLSAQSITNYLKKKQKKVVKTATERVDKEVDKNIDKAVNKGLDNVFNTLSKELEDATDSVETNQNNVKEPKTKEQTSDERLEAAMGNFMKSVGVGVVVPHKDVFVFSSSMKMLIENITEAGHIDEPVFYTSFFNATNSDYGIEFTDENNHFSCFVFDAENQCTLILTDDGNSKTGIATSLGEEDIKAMETEVAKETLPENYNLKKTGKTKTISGYKCQEYLAEDNETAITLWVTKALNGKINSRVYKNQLFSGTFWLADKTDGVVIQYISQSKIDSEKTVMTVKEIKFDNHHEINTKAYAITGIALPGTTNN